MFESALHKDQCKEGAIGHNTRRISIQTLYLYTHTQTPASILNLVYFPHSTPQNDPVCNVQNWVGPHMYLCVVAGHLRSD